MNRADLIAAMRATAAAKPTPVEVDGWGTLYVRALTVADVDEQTRESDDMKQRLVRGAARAICDEDGAKVFDPSNAEDLALLASQPWSMLQKVISAANESNALNEKGAAEAKNG